MSQTTDFRFVTDLQKGTLEVKELEFKFEFMKSYMCSMIEEPKKKSLQSELDRMQRIPNPDAETRKRIKAYQDELDRLNGIVI